VLACAAIGAIHSFVIWRISFPVPGRRIQDAIASLLSPPTALPRYKDMPLKSIVDEAF
jgi:acyl-coenzyme A synthetase/AMP-(fatty) acid ligase